MQVEINALRLVQTKTVGIVLGIVWCALCFLIGFGVFTNYRRWGTWWLDHTGRYYRPRHQLVSDETNLKVTGIVWGLLGILGLAFFLL